MAPSRNHAQPSHLRPFIGMVVSWMLLCTSEARVFTVTDETSLNLAIKACESGSNTILLANSFTISGGVVIRDVKVDIKPVSGSVTISTAKENFLLITGGASTKVSFSGVVFDGLNVPQQKPAIKVSGSKFKKGKKTPGPTAKFDKCTFQNFNNIATDPNNGRGAAIKFDTGSTGSVTNSVVKNNHSLAGAIQNTGKSTVVVCNTEFTGNTVPAGSDFPTDVWTGTDSDFTYIPLKGSTIPIPKVKGNGTGSTVTIEKTDLPSTCPGSGSDKKSRRLLLY